MHHHLLACENVLEMLEGATRCLKPLMFLVPIQSEEILAVVSG